MENRSRDTIQLIQGVLQSLLTEGCSPDDIYRCAYELRKQWTQHHRQIASPQSQNNAPYPAPQNGLSNQRSLIRQRDNLSPLSQSTTAPSHQAAQDGQTRYFCPMCPSNHTFTLLNGLKRHFNEVCLPTQRWECDCGHEYKRAERFRIHHRMEHPDECGDNDEAGCTHSNQYKIPLFPVFALGCGFCNERLEATSSIDTTVPTKFADHLARHYTRGSRLDGWSKSQVLTNLTGRRDTAVHFRGILERLSVQRMGIHALWCGQSDLDELIDTLQKRSARIVIQDLDGRLRRAQQTLAGQLSRSPNAPGPIAGPSNYRAMENSQPSRNTVQPVGMYLQSSGYTQPRSSNYHSSNEYSQFGGSHTEHSTDSRTIDSSLPPYVLPGRSFQQSESRESAHNQVDCFDWARRPHSNMLAYTGQMFDTPPNVQRTAAGFDHDDPRMEEYPRRNTDQSLASSGSNSTSASTVPTRRMTSDTDLPFHVNAEPFNPYRVARGHSPRSGAFRSGIRRITRHFSRQSSFGS